MFGVADEAVRRYASRRRPPGFDRKLAYRLLNQLLSWHDETGPVRGTDGARKKDFKANQTIYCAGLLFADLISWALHHRIGIMRTLQNLAWRRLGQANDHKFEVEGARAGSGGLDDIGDRSRRRSRQENARCPWDAGPYEMAGCGDFNQRYSRLVDARL